MSKVRFILLTIIILSSVSAVLAFKAKRSVLICTASLINGLCPPDRLCSGAVLGKIDNVGKIICHRLPPAGQPCENQKCDLPQRTTSE